MSTKNLEAIILSRRDFGEADRLITAFSKEEGKIRILAKGSRKIRSKMACHIEPFTVGNYFLVQGKSFYILAGAETLFTNAENINDIELFKMSSYICELLDMTTVEHHKNTKLYEWTKIILQTIPKTDLLKREILIRFYEFVLLESSGYQPDYTKCKKCHKPLETQDNYRGTFEGYFCSPCRGEGKNININLLKILRIFSSSNIEMILSIKGIEEYNESLKEVISPALYDIIPRIPKSKTL